MEVSQLLKTCAFLGLALVAPLFLCNCKTTAGSYKDVEYDPAKLKTPSGHGLEKRDYPFDDSGAYRKDWVRNKTRGKTRSASPGYNESTVVAAADSPAPTAPASYPTYAEASSEREVSTVGSAQSSITIPTSPAPPSPPVAAPSAPAAQYHTVVSGDTLFSLSGRYGTSVAELKRVNGLTGDSIFTDQVLRLP